MTEYKNNKLTFSFTFFILILLFASFSLSQDSEQIEQYKDSIVSLEVEATHPNSGAVVEAEATGFVLCPSGYVLTAKHTITNLRDKGYTDDI